VKTYGGIINGGLVVSLLVVIGVWSTSLLPLAGLILSLMFLIGAIFFFMQAIVMWILGVASWWEALMLLTMAGVELFLAELLSRSF
jgi:hypothetical protein